MIKLLVISDDFTGALDTGVQFAGKGMTTKVLSYLPENKEALKELQAQVLVIDAQTRHLDGSEAYHRVWELVHRAKDAGIPYIYKKTDSGLRGNIGKELEAALMASGEQYLTFIPALPAMDRITVGGVHYVEGIPIHQSAFGRDPFEPVVSPNVADLFRGVSVKTAEYKESRCYIRGEEKEIGIFDASSEAQIKAITQDLMKQNRLGVMAGCAGFASVLGDFLKLEAQKVEVPVITDRMLIICGSINEITRGQIEYAEKKGMKRITMTPVQQLNPGYLASQEGKTWLGQVKKDCESGITCVIETGISDMEKVAQYRRQKNIPLEQARVTISKTLGDVLKRLLEMGLEATLMIIGGDTLAGFITEMQCGEITIYRELEQGTVLSSIMTEGKEQWIISKSGGFGEPELLMQVEKLVKEGGRKMLDQYALSMPKAVYSGKGALGRIREIVEGNYRKAAVFTDKGIEQAGLLEVPMEQIKQAGLEVVVLTDLPAEPSCDEAQNIIEAFRQTKADLIVAVGGGSVMDIAKLASIAADGSVTVRKLLEQPGLGKKTVKTLMIPTTAGTGSEATMNSIVAVPEKELKVGIVNPEMIPDFVILDGSLLARLPKKIAASTGIDAMAHAVECFTSKKANPFSNLFAKEAAKLIFNNILPACENPDAEDARTNMLIAAFYAGAAISSSGTTAVHALSYPLGGKYHIPHGVSNAMLLLPVMRFNQPVCIQEFAKLYEAVTSDGMNYPQAGREEGSRPPITDEEKADWLLRRMEEIIQRLEIPSSLSAFGIGTKDLEELVSAGLEVKRLLNNNKKEITYEDARRLYLEVM